MRLYEKKDNLIRKNPNLTEEQKQEIIEVLNKHPSYENKVDWNRNNKLNYEDFLAVLRPLYINDLDFRGLIEGKDYDLLLDKSNEKLYLIYTYNASKIIASNSVEPKLWTEIPDWCGYEEKIDEAQAFGHFDSEHGDMKPGAKWCISMQTSNELWNDYSNDFYFVFWIRDDESLGNNQKIAISIDKENGEIADNFNASDNKISLSIPQYIEDVINENFEGIKEKERQFFLSKLKLNPETGRYDYDGDLSFSILKDFLSEDKDGFKINFGRVTGYFDCSELGLTSLKGAPQIVGGSFSCSTNQLTSLEGAPQEVEGYFGCSYNQLTSLKGAPIEVGGNFLCYNNTLISLEGSPIEVGGDFYCYNNELTSLKGAPQIVGGGFYCLDNQLISLEGAPQKVVGDFDCSWNELTSLEGAPQIVEGDFSCRYNHNLKSLEGLGEVKGEIFKDF
jgi:hypothetical protein